MAEDLIIMTRTFELLNWLLPKLASFPRNFRFSLSQRIAERTLDLNEALILAQSTRGGSRGRALQLADSHLQSLRIYMRLIHRWHWLNDGQYHHVSELLAEIGRLLGGWRKRSGV